MNCFLEWTIAIGIQSWIIPFEKKITWVQVGWPDRSTMLPCNKLNDQKTFSLKIYPVRQAVWAVTPPYFKTKHCACLLRSYRVGLRILSIWVHSCCNIVLLKQIWAPFSKICYCALLHCTLLERKGVVFLVERWSTSSKLLTQCKIVLVQPSTASHQPSLKCTHKMLPTT